MKEFYGNASIVINFNFSGVEADSLEDAIDILLNSEEMGFSLINKKTNKDINIDIQSWHIADEVGRGNVVESDLKDFYIEQED